MFVSISTQCYCVRRNPDWQHDCLFKSLERFVCMSFVIHIHGYNVGLNLEGRRYGGVSSYRSNTTLSNHSNTIPQSGRSGDEVVIHFGSGFTERGLKM